MVLDRTRVKDIQKIIDDLKNDRDRFMFLSKRLANVSADSAELYVELEEKNDRLSEVTARSAELVAELELKKEALESMNGELANANAHASELMAEIELKNEEIGNLNNALANANAEAAEIFAELEESRDELQNAKSRVKEKGSRLKTYVDVASVIFVVIGNDCRIKLINPKGCQVLGYSEKELLGRDWFEMVIPEDKRDDIRSVFQKIINGEHSGLEHIESEVITSSGKIRTIEWHNSYLKDDLGNITSTVSSGNDVTEILRLSKELEKREVEFKVQNIYLEELFEGSPEAVVVLDHDDKIIKINRKFEELFGYNHVEANGRSINDLIVPEDQKNEGLNLTNQVYKGGTIYYETKRMTKDGKLIDVSILGNPILIQGKLEAVYGIYRDISKQKEAESELKNVRDEMIFINKQLKQENILKESILKQLEQTNLRLKDSDNIKNEFISILSHDMGTPITVIKANLELIGEVYFNSLDENLIRVLKNMERASKALERLRMDTLDLSRLDMGTMTIETNEFDLLQLIDESADGIRGPAAKKRQSVTIESERSLMVRADRFKIQRVLNNYLSNAHRYSPEGKGFTISASKRGNEALVEVKDSGRGIKKEELEKIFERFYRTGKRVEGSTGLGLAIVKGIIKAHGGNSWAESEGEGKGSSFFFTIPLIS